MIKILIADDHFIVLTGLTTLLKEEFEQVEVDLCRDGNMVWEKVKACEYDLLILDITMPYTDSITLLKNILALRPDQKILILSMSSEEVYAVKYIKLGAKGFINKEAPPFEIRKAIASIINNGKYLSQKMRDTLTRHALEGAGKNPFKGLSVRELEIMNHLIDGKNVSDIANLLSVHISTISTHKANIMQKLGVSNIIELSKIAHML